MTTIDLHAHAIPRDLVTAMQDAHPDHAPTLTEREDGHHLAYGAGRKSGPLPVGMLDVKERLADMDAAGVDRQVVSAAPPNFNYALPAEIGRDFAALHNDALLALAAAAPDRLQVFAHLPMQDVDGSLAELERVAGDAAVCRTSSATPPTRPSPSPASSSAACSSGTPHCASASSTAAGSRRTRSAAGTTGGAVAPRPRR